MRSFLPPAQRACAALLVVALVLGGAGLLGTAPGAAQEPTDPADVALATPVLSARRVPGLLQGTLAGPALAEAIGGTLDRNPQTWCAIIRDEGRPVLVANPDLPLAPASLQKLLTATALLEHFGADHRLRTVMATAAPVTDGVVEGDLYLVGGGDPLWATAGYAQSFDDPNNPWVDAGLLADALVAAGIREVRGDVIGDDSRYDAERWVATWPSRYQSDPSIGPISALSINDGFTGYTETPERPNANRRAGDPPELAALTLVELLAQRGVAVTGTGIAGTAPAEAVEVAGVDSLTMGELVGEMVLDSDNNTAEMLTKELGLARNGEGTTAAGVAAMTEILGQVGIPTAGFDLKDGSGLDPTSRITCAAVMATLDRFGPDHAVTANLAVAGQTGTLYRRMRDSPATGQVRAKTGTLDTVNALAGWADTGGARLTFAAIGNGNDRRGNVAADEFAASLMTYPAGPPVAELGPRAPILQVPAEDG